MLFSIVLPTYNVASHIERCLSSLQKQTYREFEMVFVDDCGYDSSIEIIKKHKKTDNRIRIIHNTKNMGTFHARRKGVEHSLGRYIVFVDPDDEIEIELLERLYKLIDRDEPTLIFYDIQHQPKEKIFQSKTSALPFYNGNRVIESIFKKKGTKTVYHGTAGKVYKKSTLLDLYSKLNIDKDFRFIYSEDQLLHYAFLLKNPTFKSLNYKGYIYHHNKTSITHKRALDKPDVLISQKKFTNNKIQELVSQSILTNKEKQFFNFYLNKVDTADILLLQRYSENSKKYLHFVWKAFCINPTLKSMLRTLTFIFSFSLLKL